MRRIQGEGARGVRGKRGEGRVHRVPGYINKQTIRSQVRAFSGPLWLTCYSSYVVPDAPPSHLPDASIKPEREGDTRLGLPVSFILSKQKLSFILNKTKGTINNESRCFYIEFTGKLARTQGSVSSSFQIHSVSSGIL